MTGPQKYLILAYLPVALLTACGTTASQPSDGVIRVMTWNIKHGVGLDGKLDLERIAATIKAENPDIVALQEVDRGVRRSGRTDQPAQLADRTNRKATFGHGIFWQGGEFGNALLTRERPVTIRNHPLPGEEPRSLLGAEVTLPQCDDIRIWVFSTHYDLRTEDRIAGADSTVALLSQLDQPWILSGDLNAPPDSEPLDRLLTIGTTATPDQLNTFPADQPDRQIDYILAGPPGAFGMPQTHVLEESVASDHRPVLAEYPCPNVQ